MAPALARGQNHGMANKQDRQELHDAFARLTDRQYLEAQRLGNGTVGIGIGRALDESADRQEAEQQQAKERNDDTQV